MTTYSHASSKLGRVTAPTKSKAKEIFDAAQKAGHDVWFMWGYDPNKSNTEHHSGRALDFMVRNKAAGDWIRNYIWTHRKRLKLQHVIWYQRITSTVTSPGVVRKMADRGNTTANHMDHVHVLFFDGAYVAPDKDDKKPAKKAPKRKTNDEIADEVIAGKWGNGHERVRRLTSAGYSPSAIQKIVDRKFRPPKTVAQIASEVIDGRWGDGDVRVQRLTRAGYDAKAVQKEVNRQLGVRDRKTISELATEVIAGEWGDGDVRVQRLSRAGYNAKAVQAEVNRRYR